jgi:hypothetical protein
MTKQKKTLTRAESMDDEARTLAASADFRSLLNEGRTAPATPLEQLDQRRPVSAEDRQLADEYLTVLGRLEAQQEAEVTEAQAHVLNLILVAARALRNGRTIAEWAEYAGLPEDEARAAVAALEMIGAEGPQPAARSG